MNFSIELSSEKIYDPRTKLYFKEVLSSYYNGNYRSAIVMLYSTVICDLMYKLLDLRDLYNDKNAKQIVDELDKLHKREHKFSEWEARLIDSVKTKTKLFNSHELSNFENLKSDRNFSAHPSIDEDYKLFEPNRETARAHIRNMLEATLIKTPFLSKYSKELFYSLLNDLEENRTSLSNDNDLERYVNSRYLNKMSSDIEIEIFRNLWKLAINDNTEESQKNRNIMLRVLKIFVKRNEKEVLLDIESRSEHYSKFSNDLFEYLFVLLVNNKKIYKFLNEATKTVIKNRIQNNKPGDEKYFEILCYSWFLKDDMLSHLDNLRKHFGVYTAQFLKTKITKRIFREYVSEGLKENLIDLYIDLFCLSSNYNEANYRFDVFIEPFLKEFNSQQMINMLTCMENNNQIHYRMSARACNSIIKEQSDALLGSNYDYEKYFPIFYDKLF